MAFHIDIPVIVAVAVIVVIAILLCLLLFLAKHRRSSQYRIEKVLKPLRREEVKNIIIPDGIGGMLEVEHLILMEQGLLLIETYPMSGHLFGAEKIDHWTQIQKGRSYSFANPLRHIRTSRQALMSLVPNIPIQYRIIFSAQASFPKGKPEQVSVLDSLLTDMESVQSGPLITESAQQAWDRILRISRKTDKNIEAGEAI